MHRKDSSPTIIHSSAAQRLDTTHCSMEQLKQQTRGHTLLKTLRLCMSLLQPKWHFYATHLGLCNSDPSSSIWPPNLA